MKKIFSDFATYTQKKVGMDHQVKEKIKQDVGYYYSSLYGEDSTTTKVRGFIGGFFQPPVTFAKLAVYIIGTTTLTTGVYAGVAPESFSQTSKAVSTTVQKAVVSSLEVLHMKEKSPVAERNNDNEFDEDRQTTTVISSISINTGTQFENDGNSGGGNKQDDDLFNDGNRDSWRYDDHKNENRGSNRDKGRPIIIEQENSRHGGEIRTTNTIIPQEESRHGKKDEFNPIITVWTGTTNSGFVSNTGFIRSHNDDRDDDSREKSNEREGKNDDNNKRGRDSNDREEFDD